MLNEYPLSVTNVMILVSFWMEGIMRIFANSLGVILLIGTFLQMSAFVPQLSNPKICKYRFAVLSTNYSNNKFCSHLLPLHAVLFLDLRTAFRTR